MGGVPNKQEGLIVYQNFTGCIENFYVNSTNLIREIKDSYESEYTPYRFQKINTIEACPVSVKLFYGSIGCDEMRG